MIRSQRHLLSKVVTAAAFAVVAASAGSGQAQAQTQTVRVEAVVETPDAIFFQPSVNPNVVWFFPRSEVRLFPLNPPVPGGNYWRTTVELARVNLATLNLAALRPDWAGKTPVSYIVRPTTECVLNRLPEMFFPSQEVRAARRDIVANAALPVCQFLFLLFYDGPPSAQIEALRASGRLITRDLPISLELPHKIAWSIVHAAVADVLDGDGGGGETRAVVDPTDPTEPTELTYEEAIAAIEAALAGPRLGAVDSRVTDAERAAFITAAFQQLFAPGTQPDRYVLVEQPPSGQLIYHLELIQRSM